jgi:hypothetical protein
MTSTRQRAYAGPSDYARAQRRRQAEWKRTTAELSPAARFDGTWDDRAVAHLLPLSCADENLWTPIRAEVRAYFAECGIAWHDEDQIRYGARSAVGPSSNLLDSQISALNFWWGLAQTPGVLTAVLCAIFDDAREAVAPESSGKLVLPEWIGQANYLGERGRRRRGKFATSADLLVAYVDRAGARHGVLLESKYTEQYLPDDWRRVSSGGTDRAAIYQPSYQLPDSPFRPDAGPVGDLLIEPFDQHLRQQLLAAAMERAHELGFSTVTCLHVAPAANRPFHAGITAPTLVGRGATVAEAWRALLRDPRRYRSAAYEDIFARVADDGPWSAYQQERYGWS